jgi:predicted RNase H-like HicB family nuclease
MDATEFAIEFDLEVDGRWIADIAELPGVMAYGSTQEEARSNVVELALRVLADES